MSDENQTPEIPTTPEFKLPEAPKAEIPEAPKADIKAETPISEAVSASAVAHAAPAAPSIALPKAKFGIGGKPASSVQSAADVSVKKNENPSMISIAIDGLTAAVAIAFAVMIFLDI